MKKVIIFLALSSVLFINHAFAKTPVVTTPNISDQEYAKALGFELQPEATDDAKTADKKEADPKVKTETHKADDKNAATTNEKPRPVVKKKDLVYRCDISLSQPFAVETQQKKIELALGVGQKEDSMVIKLQNKPVVVKRTHYDPEHLHIWSNPDEVVIMTLDVDEVYKDNFVALQSGTLTVLTPEVKEEYKAVLTCKP
ncbi:hypothetical protein DC083_07310 [Ignatzschineria ureiclastica]|uniref:Uncharacterized protein n=1 Tax=Ignatzschineria ureiclastica TaxID=472582 RepID=A0A2U2AE20_9GAMM|nr:hypothetical protein [Ignatzschineria ureiclastica]PWD80904.1 hypothetical protein DC083_07310 [Ignatzschineria ureiclastica]GGZ93993.1 hypothetical protein GCM10007162_06940 [Ignatzschineria ureiclastica]